MASSRKGRRSSLEDEQRALAEATIDPRSTAASECLHAALRSHHALVVARAASLIRQHGIGGFDADLADAFERFLRDPAKTDPSCHAKLAAIEALDYSESTDAEPFLKATRHVQKERAWGPPVDTAAGVRARGVLALARIGYEQLDLVAAEALADPESPVRQAALEALAHRGSAAGAGLALLKLRVGDEDPLVTLAAMSTLLSVAPEWGLGTLRPLLDGTDEQRREIAAMALGQSRNEGALAMLLEALERCVRAAERVVLLRAIAIHRSEPALGAILKVIAEGNAADAEAAIEALAVRRFEPAVVEQVRAAARRNESDLDAIVAEAFAATEDR